MPSRWKRGESSGNVAGAFRRSVSAGTAVFGMLLSAWLAGGCENPAQTADRETHKATTRAVGGAKVTPVDAGVVNQVITESGVTNAAEAAAALAPLREVKVVGGRGENWFAYSESLAKLNAAQREALAKGVRVASFTDLQAEIAALTAAAATPGNTNEAKIDPLIRLALAETAAGDLFAADAAEYEVAAATLRSDAVLLLDRVNGNTQRLQAVAEVEKALPIADTDARKTAVEGTADSYWGEGTSVDGQPLKLPSMARHKAETARLTAEIADLKAKQAALLADQQKELQAADADATKSNQYETEGRAEMAYNAALSAAEHRAKAAKLGLEASGDPGDGTGVTVKILLAEQELRRLQAGQSWLSQVTEDSERRKARLEREQTTRQSQAAELKRQSMALLVGTPGQAPTTRPSGETLVDPSKFVTGLPTHVASDAVKQINPGEPAALHKAIDAAATPKAAPTTRATTVAEKIKAETGVQMLLNHAATFSQAAAQARTKANQFYAAALSHNTAADTAAAAVTQALNARIAVAAEPKLEVEPLKHRVAMITPAQFILRDGELKARQAALLANEANSAVQQAVVRRIAEKTFDDARAVDATVAATPAEVTGLADAAAADAAVVKAYDAYGAVEQSLIALLPTSNAIGAEMKNDTRGNPVLVADRKNLLETKIRGSELFGTASAPTTMPSTAATYKLGQFFVDPAQEKTEQESASRTKGPVTVVNTRDVASRDGNYCRAALTLVSHVKYAQAGLLKSSLWLTPTNEDRKKTVDQDIQSGDLALAAYRLLYGAAPAGTPSDASARVIVPPTIRSVVPGFRPPPPPAATQPTEPGGLFPDANGGTGTPATQPTDGSTPATNPAPTPPTPPTGTEPAPAPPTPPTPAPTDPAAPTPPAAPSPTDPAAPTPPAPTPPADPAAPATPTPPPADPTPPAPPAPPTPPAL